MAPKVNTKKHKKRQASSDTQVRNSSKSWLDLPNQLANTITKKHPNLEKNINFGGIIKSWRRPSKHCNQGSTLPWLQLYNPDASNTEKYRTHIEQGGTHNASYFSYVVWNCWCRSVFTTMPKYPWKDYVGCSNGILVAEGKPLYMYYLWNPTQREWLHLPLWDPKLPIKLAVLSSSPEDQNCTVMVLTGISHPAFAFYKLRRGSNMGFTQEMPQWTKQDCTLTKPLRQPGKKIMQFTNAIGFKGKFYALSLQGNLAVIEEVDSVYKITGLSDTRIVPSVSSNHFREYMVESGGELLLVFLISRKSSVHVVDDVEVYQLNLARLSWFKLESLGEKTVFVGNNCSMCVLASEVGCKRNCIYFRNTMVDEWWLYDMESGIISLATIWIEPTEEESLSQAL